VKLFGKPLTEKPGVIPQKDLVSNNVFINVYNNIGSVVVGNPTTRMSVFNGKISGWRDGGFSRLHHQPGQRHTLISSSAASTGVDHDYRTFIQKNHT
jgi:hypothetical protein